MQKTYQLMKVAFITISLFSTSIIPIFAHADSTQMEPQRIVDSNIKPQRYQSSVDTNNCVTTNKKVFVVIAGIGGGNLDQQCPPDHPVMYNWDQTVAYTTAVPFFGAVMGAGGNTTVRCCAMKYQWTSAS